MRGVLRTYFSSWWRRGIAAFCVLLCGFVALYLCAQRSPIAAASNMTTAIGDWLPAKRSDFEVLCREEGELRAAKVTTMTFLRWGKISYLIPEGSAVKKGDKLVALDTKDAEEELQRHAEDLAAGERDLAQREQTRDLELKRFKMELTIEKERADVAALNEQDLLSRPRPIDREDAETTLEVAKTRLANAKAVLDAYKPLADSGFGSGSELATRELDVTKAEVELKRAETKYNLVIAGSLPEVRAKAKLDRELADLSAKVKEIDFADQTDDLNAKVRGGERYVGFHQRRLRAHKEEYDRSIIYAPHEGVAVYRVIEWRGNKKVEVGEQAGPWLSPMELPNYEKMKVRTQVPESFIRKIHARGHAGNGAAGEKSSGSPARVVVKTLPDRVYKAEVTWIDGWARDRNSKLSDADIKAQGMSGVRVFDVEVELLESDPQNLREGFRATVEFPVETYQNLISVPISAISNRDGVPHVQMQRDGVPEWHKVELGMQSLDRVVVTDGVNESDMVFVPRAAPPPKAVEKTIEDAKDAAKNGAKPAAKRPGDGGAPPFPAQGTKDSGSSGGGGPPRGGGGGGPR